MDTQSYHELILETYLAHRKNHPTFTFHLRSIDTKNRLSNGAYFLGTEKYLASSPFKPREDGKGNVFRIGFKLDFNKKQCLLTLSLKTIMEEESTPSDNAYKDFYLECIKILELNKNSPSDDLNYTAATYKKILGSTDDVKGCLEYFLTEEFPKIEKLAEQYNVPKEILYYSEEEFQKKLEKVTEIQKNIADGVNPQMEKSLAQANQEKFEEWLQDQKTQLDTSFDLKTITSSIDKFYTDKKTDKSIFAIKDISLIDELHKKCGKGGELSEWNKKVGNGQPSQAIKQYLNFLQSNAPKDAAVHPFNQILYGAAGTGKTYHTVNHALAVIEGRKLESYEKEDRITIKQRFDTLVKNKQIQFLTFHQNFAYEDFIEGIKPSTNGGSISYDIQQGVFRQIADLAQKSDLKLNEIEELNENPTVWKASLGEQGKFTQYCFDNNRIVLAYEKDSYIYKSFEKMEVGDLVGVYKKSSGETAGKLICGIGVITSEEVLESLESNDTPKYYREVKWLLKDKILNVFELNNNKRMTLATYHKTKIDATKLLALAGLANKKNNKENYVLIIDEINRGNIAKIFGELITLIESSKREGRKEAVSVTLPYSRDSFSVPNNLYIIGTMNTTDRSIALLDTALRRRFKFIEMMPKPELLEGKPVKDTDISLANLLRSINNRITVLLDREHQIGHSYFLSVESLDALRDVFQNQVIPLLQEYFYSDWENIDKVLNKNGFIINLKQGEAFKQTVSELDSDEAVYSLADFAPDDDSNIWNNDQSYIDIYQKKSSE